MSEATPPLAPLPTDLSQLQLTLDPKPTAYFGRGRVAETGTILTTLGARAVLVVTDPFLATSPIVARVLESIAAAGIRASVYSDVTANPTTDAIDAGSDVAAAFQADAIVAVGGGSSMDAAKGIALGAVNPQRGLDLDYSTDFEHPALPIVAIPTTAGTGAEVTAFGVITDVRARRKFYVGHESTTARAAILDPELTVGLPPAATAATGMDALTHSVESYLSVRANPFSDALALQVISTVATYLPRATADGSDIEARSHMLLASHIAGVGFSHTGLGLVHGIAHPLGGRYDIPHGLALCMVIEQVLRFNLPARPERIARLAHALGVATSDGAGDAEAAISAIANLTATVGMKARLSDFGIGEADLSALADDTLDDAVIANNPVTPTKDDVLAILRSAL